MSKKEPRVNRLDHAPIGSHVGFPVVRLCSSLGSVLDLGLAASAASTPSGKQLDVATKGFGLHMKVTLTKHWQVLPSDSAGPHRARRSGWCT